jgi:hypothetical protein
MSGAVAPGARSRRLRVWRPGKSADGELAAGVDGVTADRRPTLPPRALIASAVPSEGTRFFVPPRSRLMTSEARPGRPVGIHLRACRRPPSARPPRRKSSGLAGRS